MFIRSLNEGLENLTGVGKATLKSYAGLGLKTFSDLLGFCPRAYEDRSKLIPVGMQDESGIINTFVVVRDTTYFGPRHTLKVTVTDISTPDYRRNLFLVCFNRPFLKDVLKIGHKFWIYGTVSMNYGELQSTAFEISEMKDGGMPKEFGRVLPIYPLSGNLTQKTIRRDVASVLSRVRHFEDEIPDSLMRKYRLLPFDTAIRLLHNPETTDDIRKARRTLAYCEVFYLQLAARRGAGAAGKRGEGKESEAERRFIRSLPYSLTGDQKTVLEEIRCDMSQQESMNRLLQGDVGCGKTVVAWISALHAINRGEQVAFMAPTELLARQHAQKADELLSPLGIRVAFLTSSVPSARRKLLLKALENGEIDILIGTHALFSRDVVFKKLGYVIIDEQHRFGVGQRLSLFSKGSSPDMLMMTATPIPRSLALTVFGDLNVSTIKTMPVGRKEILTRLVSESRRAEMYEAIGTEFKRGHQAYFVYPRIDEDPDSNLRDVSSMYDFLKLQYPGVPSALIHSKLDEETKVRILNDFAAGKISYLVSTSVVEVGIDVANATCMVIEHAERFGLAALHQLRGRVGRSSLQSWCFLVYTPDLTDDAKQRLKVMHETTDGFKIAEKDLEIRGPGEIAGTRQSGFFRLKFANLATDINMIEAARTDVDKIIVEDPGLLSAENSVIRRVLSSTPAS